MKTMIAIMMLSLCGAALAADNELTAQEKEDGWLLLFDGKTLDGWMTGSQRESRRPVEDGCINPRKCGGYMMIHKELWSDFVLSLDFLIEPGCNTGIFLRTFPLKRQRGKDVGYNGIEVAIDDTTGAGYHDTGAIYDLMKPTKNAMKPAGKWNHIVITCDRNIIDVVLNGEPVIHMDLDEFAEPNMRPDGTKHKFTDQNFKDHPRSGYIGLQDHGSECWFKNIKLLPIKHKEPEGS